MTETREAKVRERALRIASEKWEEIGPHLERAMWLAEAVAIKAYAAGREDGIEDRWVSVDDQLPGVSYNYLVCDSDGDVEEASFFKDNGEWRSVATYGIDSEHEDLHPLYWQALPNAPRSLSSKKGQHDASNR